MSDTAAAKGPAPREQHLVRLLKTNPPAAAGAMLGLFLVPPLVMLLMMVGDGWNGWCTVSAVIMAAAAVPSLGILLKQPWANAAGQYLCWAELVQVALRIVSTSFRPLHALPAGVALVALLTLTSAQAAPAAGRERPPDSLGLWLKENIEAIVVAFIMALVIRCFCIEVFKIPSSSMEPTLLGDNTPEHQGSPRCPFQEEHENPGGDRIMVTKYYYALSSIDRYDVVVFKFPLNQAKNFIKRVVGLPDEKLKIYHGNIYVRHKGEDAFRIARRTLRTQDSMWIAVDGRTDYLASRDTFDKHWKIGDAAHPAEVQISGRELSTLEKGGARDIRFEHLGRIADGYPQEVGELQLAFDFELTSAHGSVFAEIANEYGRFEMILSADGPSELRFHRPDGDGKRPFYLAPLKDVKLAPDRRHHLALSVFDGTVYARVDGDVMEKYSFIETRDKVFLQDSAPRGVAFGSTGATLKVRNLTLGRDVYYKGKQHIPEDVEIDIKPGSYVMMGDNVESSHDARSWTRQSIQLKDGRTLYYEQQDARTSESSKCQEIQQRYGLKKEPDFILKADQYGIEYALYTGDQELPPGGPWGVVAPGGDSSTGESFPWVEEKFIVGKALWIWWPKGRWFRLIR